MNVLDRYSMTGVVLWKVVMKEYGTIVLA